jgi:hypothetical protein
VGEQEILLLTAIDVCYQNPSRVAKKGMVIHSFCHSPLKLSLTIIKERISKTEKPLPIKSSGFSVLGLFSEKRA